MRYRSLLLTLSTAALLGGCNLGPDGPDSPTASYLSTCDVEEAAKVFVDDGANPNRRYDNPIYPALFVAAGGDGSGPGSTGCLEVVEMLVNQGADPTATARGNGVLFLVALHQEDPAVVDYLVANGADPCLPQSSDAQERYGVDTLVSLAHQETVPSVANAIERAAADC